MAWIPWSPCDASCLPAPGTLDEVPAQQRLMRYALTVAVIVAAFVTALALPLLTPVRRARAVQQFARWLLAALGVRLDAPPDRRLSDSTPGAGTLVVANHVSWLDVIALLAVEPVGMLAKRETREWPFIGTIADRIGTVYADRERLRALPGTVAELAGTLRSGRSMVVFPEATTWCGTSSGRFRPAMFQAAIDAAAPIRPVAVRYRLAGGRSTTVAAFIGEDTLLASLRRIARTNGLVVDVRPRTTLAPDSGRRNLARRAEAAITALPAHRRRTTVIRTADGRQSSRRLTTR